MAFLMYGYNLLLNDLEVKQTLSPTLLS